MQRVPVAAAFLLLVAGCNEAHGDPAALGGSAGGLSVQQGGYVPGTTACPAFACTSDARIWVDYPLSYEETLASGVTACRNAVCFHMKLLASMQPPTLGRAVSLYNEGAAVSQYDRADVLLGLDSRGLYLELQWHPNRPQNGDRYSTKVVDRSGMTHMVLDQQIEYRDASIGRPGAPCFQDCKSAELDLREGAP